MNIRKAVLGFLVLAALVVPLGLAGPAAAARKPVKLRLIRVEAIETNDGGLAGGPADELVVEVNGVIVFGPEDILNGQALDLSGVGDRKFRRKIDVTLIDQDVTSGDDDLGTATIRRGAAGDGVQTVLLQENGAIYNLVFKVVR